MKIPIFQIYVEELDHALVALALFTKAKASFEGI